MSFSENRFPFFRDMRQHYVASACTARQSIKAVWFTDISGNRIELVVRPLNSGWRYFPSRDGGIRGLADVILRSVDVEKDLPICHIGLCTTDAARDEAFWTKVCSARVSDRIGEAALLRIDEVHHTIALSPAGKAGIQHINHQVATGDDVMRSFEYSSGVREIADELIYRERQFPFDPKGFCQWGAKPQIKEFRN